MARLTSPTGVTVNVSDEKADRLKSVGYSEAKSSEQKAPAKKVTPSKTSNK